MSKKVLRTLSILIADLLAVALSLFLAALATNGIGYLLTTEYLVFFGINAFFVFATLSALRLYSVVFANVGIIEGVKVAIAVFVVALLNLLLRAIFRFENISYITILFYASTLFYLIFLLRFYKRIIKLFSFYFSRGDENKKRVMIIGAGNVGETTLEELRRNKNQGFYPVCVLDDDESKIGTIFNGVKVVGNTFQIEKFAEQYKVEEIFVAIANIPPEKMTALLKRAGKTDLPVKRIPATIDIVNGKISLSTFKNIEIQDLLGRAQVEVDLNQIMGYIENQTVLITGGGGSIGSELCRQIATHNPKRLIILDLRK